MRRFIHNNFCTVRIPLVTKVDDAVVGVSSDLKQCGEAIYRILVLYIINIIIA